MQDNFLLGCNYWASHAGVDMWCNWDEEVVRRDMELMRENGISCLRMFINWRDFQPVKALYRNAGMFKEYRMVGDILPTNRYYLDETMLERFHCFCKLAEEYEMQLIVGIVTGWMSGRLFVPPALDGKNLFTDPTALMFQQLLIKGFVTEMKDEPAIVAWNLGNECNCLAKAETREEAYNWTSIIANTIRACDASRPVVSGMHGMGIDAVWNITDQGEATDMLTTHPYPLWVQHCQIEPLTSQRILLHATAQTQYYKDISKKPRLVEEIGTMGPMVCDEDVAAGFMKVNLYSNWVNGAAGLLWWCAFEQTHLDTPPYAWNMHERELGMFDAALQPKPLLLEMKQFAADKKERKLILAPRRRDGVILLSQNQDHWGIAFMTYVLAKQAGLVLDFAYCEDELPDSDFYFMPSVTGSCMTKETYFALKEKVAAGAKLYISMDKAFISEFEEFTGLLVTCASESARSGNMLWKDGREADIPYAKGYQFRLRATRAEVLAEEEDGNPAFTRAKYGAGEVYVLNFPMENMLITKENGFEHDYCMIYEEAAKSVYEKKYAWSKNRKVGVTEHVADDAVDVVLINYSFEPQDTKLMIKESWEISEVLFGNAEVLEPCEAAAVRLKLK